MKRFAVLFVGITLLGCSPSNEKLLEQAKTSAGGGNHMKAVVLAEDIASDSPAGAEAAKLIPQWKREAVAKMVSDVFGIAGGIEALDSQRRAKIARLQSNAHTLQTMVESYGVDNGGHYPATVAELTDAAFEGEYYKVLINPYNSSSPSIVDFSKAAGGAVGYEMTAKDKTAYKLHIWDEKGKPVFGDDGKEFVLSGL